MKSITIHNLDEETSQLIEERSKRQGLSLNKTIKNLLKKSLGMGDNNKRKRFKKFSGVWSQKDFNEFEKNTKDFERIDKEDWL